MLLKVTLVCAALVLAGVAYADSDHGKMAMPEGHGSMPMQEGMADTQAMGHETMSMGTVKKINPEAGKIMIEHGPLKNLDMPGMTMVFRVQDNAMLDQIKTGDQIHFIAQKVDGKLVVTKLQPVK